MPRRLSGTGAFSSLQTKTVDLIELDILNLHLLKKSKNVDTILVDRENNAKHSEMKVKYQLYLLKCFFFLPVFLMSL